jgi:hypothetical protein
MISVLVRNQTIAAAMPAVTDAPPNLPSIPRSTVLPTNTNSSSKGSALPKPFALGTSR